jgi:hypothetical protein
MVPIGLSTNYLNISMEGNNLHASVHQEEGF